ncbi:MAG: response regulator [Chloroflexota bacterium]|nr:response regulator [Chloroflexota bacterium]
MAYEMFKVLIVDDDPLIMKLYTNTLEAQHYEIIQATNGEEALKKAFQESPDIILLDIMMPGMDGHEVCSRLRAAPRTSDLPIIMLTALSGVAARQKALEVGADDFMTKKEPPSNIDGRIKMLIKQRILAHTRSWLAELPGSVAADYSLRAQLATGLSLAVCYVNLDDLAEFNERAGFQEGDRVLWQLARILLEKVREGDEGDFTGHYGGDAFVVITTPQRAEPLSQSIIQAFDAVMREWSGGAPSARGFPTLSIAIIIIESGQSLHPAQIGGLGQSLLRQAKEEPGSTIRIAQL